MLLYGKVIEFFFFFLEFNNFSFIAAIARFYCMYKISCTVVVVHKYSVNLFINVAFLFFFVENVWYYKIF